MGVDDYSHIFERAEVGIALNDPDAGTVGVVNEHYADLMGYSRGALEDMAIEEISAEDPSFDQQAAMRKIRRALKGERQQFDWLFERADGSQFWGEVVLKRTTIGDHERLLAFVRDISERKHNERQLERQNERLELFAELVSHDLRNPLNVATGQLELLQETYESEHLDELAWALARMNELIETVLTLARDGRQLDETEPVELDELAKRCWGTVATPSADLVVATDQRVEADRRRLKQLFENLFGNAVDHGGPDVTITVGGLEAGFYVADDGPGIAVDDREAVFELGHSAVPNSTGFGLSIVAEIANAHDWDVAVTESAAGGARFEFTGVTTPDT